jgi:hypothetical protein
MGRCLASLGNARFTWDRVTDRVEAAYRETLHQGRRSMARAG